MAFSNFPHKLAIKLFFLRCLGWILVAMPWRLDSLLFSFFYPVYIRGHQKELSRMEAHLQASYLRSHTSPRQVYRNLFVNGMDSLRFLRRKSETLARLTFENESLLHGVLEEGSPVVLASIHSGAFEMLHRSLEFFGKPIHLIASDFPDQALSFYLREIRTSPLVQVHTPDKAPLVLRQVLRGQGMLALMLDQSKDTEGNETVLLGRRTRLFFRLPQEANRLGATLITFCAIRQGDRHIIRFKKAYAPCQKRETIIEGLTAEVQSWIRENPEQWTWNYPGNWTL